MAAQSKHQATNKQIEWNQHEDKSTGFETKMEALPSNSHAGDEKTKHTSETLRTDRNVLCDGVAGSSESAETDELIRTSRN